MIFNQDEYGVEEEQISDEDWDALVSGMGKHTSPVPNGRPDMRDGRQAPVPPNLPGYLNKLQLATINKMENFGWQLFFIRRSNPEETLTIMHFPGSGETALIEKDGTVNKAHGVYIRE